GCAADRGGSGRARTWAPVHRPHLLRRSASRSWEHAGHVGRRHHPRCRRKCRAHIARCLLGASRRVRDSAARAGRQAGRLVRPLSVKGATLFTAGAAASVILALVLTRVAPSEYFFFAAYVVLQFIVLATAWNILGGYAGYVNFGSGAFFAVGAYTAV